MGWVSLCELSELQEGLPRFVEIEGFHLAVAREGDRVFALDDRCPHAGGSLSGGPLIDHCAVCPRHGWAFELATGQMPGARGVAVRAYPVRILHREQGPPLVQAELPIY